MYFTPAWVYTRVLTQRQQNVRSFYGMLGNSFRGEILAIVALRKNRRLEPMLTAPLFIIRRMQGMATISMHGWYAMNYNFMYIRRVQYSSCYNMLRVHNYFTSGYNFILCPLAYSGKPTGIPRMAILCT